MEYFDLQLKGQTVLELGQGGDMEFGGGSNVEESELWKVRCQPGRVDIVTPAVQISLKAGDGGSVLQLDPRFSKLLRPGGLEVRRSAERPRGALRCATAGVSEWALGGLSVRASRR